MATDLRALDRHANTRSAVTRIPFADFDSASNTDCTLHIYTDGSAMAGTSAWSKVLTTQNLNKLATTFYFLGIAAAAIPADHLAIYGVDFCVLGLRS